MDYDALTGEVYVPDEQHNRLDVLTPIDPGATKLPGEPNRVIRTGAPPAAVAVTNDGLLGFVALRGGQVAMLDLIDAKAASQALLKMMNFHTQTWECHASAKRRVSRWAATCFTLAFFVQRRRRE